MIRPKAPTLTYGAPPRVSLLPSAERERRERAALARRWSTVALAVVVLMVVLSGGMALYERSAHASLTAERARTTELEGELATYHDVSTATRTRSSYQTFRTQTMATDVSWSDLLGKLQAKVPAGAAISQFDALTSPDIVSASSGDSSASSAATAPPPANTAVTVTLTLTSNGALDQKAILLGLQKVPGVLRVDLTSLSSDDFPSYTATTVVYLDDTAYSGSYAPEASQ